MAVARLDAVRDARRLCTKELCSAICSSYLTAWVGSSPAAAGSGSAAELQVGRITLRNGSVALGTRRGNFQIRADTFPVSLYMD